MKKASRNFVKLCVKILRKFTNCEECVEGDVK